MTYENVLQWLIDNVPVSQSQDYKDWLNQSMKEINTPSLWDNPSFNKMHEKAWIDISKKQLDREESLPELEHLGEGELPDKLEVTRRPDIQTGSIETRITYREPLTFREQVGQAIPDRQVIDVREDVDSPAIEDRTENQAERILSKELPRPRYKPSRLNRIRAFVDRLFRKKRLWR